MPEIPTFAATPVPIPEVRRSFVSPEALAAPGREQERTGKEVEQLGGVFGQLADRIKQAQDLKYVTEQQADATHSAYARLDSARDEAQKSGDYSSFAYNISQQTDQDLRQRLDQAPSDEARLHLEQHFGELSHEISSRASIFEHLAENQDAGAKRAADLQATTMGVFHDPTRLRTEWPRIAGAIQGAQAAGYLNPKEAQEERENAGDSLAVSQAKGRIANNDDAGLAADFAAGRYDSMLSLKGLERMLPLISSAKSQSAGDEAWQAAHGGAVALPPDANASDADIDKALAPIIQRETGGNLYAGYTSPATMRAQGQVTDLRNAPLDPHGAPIWAGDMGPAGRSHAFGPAQIQPGTWAPIADKLGIKDWRAPGAYMAVARELYRKQGGAPWAASAGGVPDLDAGMAHIQRQVDTGALTAEEGDRATGLFTRRYHEWSQATAGERADLERELGDGLAMLKSGGNWSPDTASIYRLLPPDKATEALQQIDEARDFGNARNVAWWATPAELQQQQQRIAEGLKDPTDFARKQRYAQQYASVVQERQKALQADPAAYVAQSPEVQRAAAAIDQENPGAGIQAAIGASLAQQDRLGVPPDMQRVLTRGAAAHIVGTIVKADPGTVDMGAQLDNLAHTYGDYWQQAFGDLVEAGLPPAYQILASMAPERDEQGNIKSDDQAAARSDLQRALAYVAEKGGAEKLKDFAGTGASVIGQNIDEPLGLFRQTVMHNDGGLDLYGHVRDAVKNLAYWYAGQGMDASKALGRAYEGIIGSKYDFDGTIRALKGTLPDVEYATQRIVNGFTADDMPDIGGNPYLTPEQRQGEYLKAVQRGSWVPNKDETGLVLMARFRNGVLRPAHRGDGSLIQVKFSEIPKVVGPVWAPPDVIGAEGLL